MKIINITICIFIVILSIVIFNVFINCKSIHENFGNIDSQYIGYHYILPDTKSISTTNVHYTIDPLNIEQYKLIENQNDGLRCGNERDNYYFINLNPGSSDSNFNLLYDPVLNGKIIGLVLMLILREKIVKNGLNIMTSAKQKIEIT